MNLITSWQHQLRLNQLQNLRSWLEQVKLHDLYGGALGKVMEVSSQYFQDEGDSSKIALIADGRRMIEITCFHKSDCYCIETLVRIIDLDDKMLNPESYLLLVLFLLDEINGQFPYGYLVNRMEGTVGEIHLCWVTTLPKSALKNETTFQSFLREHVGGFLFDVVVPHIEEEFAEFISILRRTEEFALEEEGKED